MTEDQEITLLVDTGADISLIKRTKINPRQILHWSEATKIKGITDEFTKSLTTTNTDIFVTNYAISHKFHVVNTDFPIPADGILGREFITKYQCQLDYANWTINISTNCRNITAPTSLITIPPRCEVIRYINELNNINYKAVVSNSELIPGVFIANTIILKNNPLVKLINTNLKSVMIRN